MSTQDSNHGDRLGGAQRFDQGGDSERSRSPGQDNNPTKIIRASQNHGRTAQSEDNSQGARGSPLVASPTAAQAPPPVIRAEPTVKLLQLHSNLAAASMARKILVLKEISHRSTSPNKQMTPMSLEIRTGAASHG